MRKLRLAFGGFALTAAVAFWIGCGSSEDNSLITGGDDAGSEAAATPPPTPPPPPPPPADSDAGDAGDAADLPDGSIAADGGQNVQDAGPGGSATTLPCGTASCAIPSQSCCVSLGGGGGGGASYQCVVGPPANCPNTGGGGGPDTIALKCSSSANCAAGEQCCANIGAGGVVQSNCVPWGTCAAGDGGQPDHAVLCSGDAGTNGCDAGVSCSSNNITDWALPSTFATCGGRGGPF